jgi:hypothetical protein
VTHDVSFTPEERRRGAPLLGGGIAHGADVWHDGPMTDRYERRVADEVAALERDIMAYLPDLEEAWSLRDWAGVARIYRVVASIADRLERLDPDARSVQLAKAEAVFEAQAALAGSHDAEAVDDPWPPGDAAGAGGESSGSDHLDPGA